MEFAHAQSRGGGAQLKTKRLGSKDKTMCSFWLNTSFLEDGCTVLPKAEIDKCHQVPRPVALCNRGNSSI